MDINGIKTLMNVGDNGQFKTAINKTSGYLELGKDGTTVRNTGNHWYNFFYRPSQDAEQNRRTREALVSAFKNSGLSDSTMKMVRSALGVAEKNDLSAQRPLSRRLVKQILFDVTENEQKVAEQAKRVNEAKNVVQDMVNKISPGLVKSFSDRVLTTLEKDTGFAPEANPSDAKLLQDYVMGPIKDGVVECASDVLKGNMTRDEATSKLGILYDTKAYAPAGLRDEDKAYGEADKLTAGVVRKLNAILKNDLNNLLDMLEAQRKVIAQKEAELLNDPYKEYGDMSDSDLSE